MAAGRRPDRQPGRGRPASRSRAGRGAWLYPIATRNPPSGARRVEGCRRPSPERSSSSTTAPFETRSCSSLTATTSRIAASSRFRRSSRRPTGSRRTRFSGSRTCSSSCCRTTGRAGVAVAWDTRPVHRTEISAEYKSERRPMPDLLREQFPHFRPIVEAFGYRNLEFEGWEADDVIATLATHADEAGIKTCVVSTDRDAFQLVSENVCLMMTPRGVADVHVYTPERVEARYGVRPGPGARLHRAQGRHERQHPRHPRHRGQDGGTAHRPVRHARRRDRARGRALARSISRDRGERRSGTRVEAPGHDATRSRPRRRDRRPRLAPSGSLAAEGDLPPLRVSRASQPGRHPRRGATGRRAAEARDADGSVA